jgi:hypothetical protein
MNRDASRNSFFFFAKIIQANGGRRDINRILYGILCFAFIYTAFVNNKQKSVSYVKMTRLFVPLSEIIIGLET